MTALRKIKSYLTTDGDLIFVDPDPEHLPLIRQFNPAFAVRSKPPPTGFVPNLATTRGTRTGLPQEMLARMDNEALWRLHVDGLARRVKDRDDGSATLLDVKVELARRQLLDCRLCGHLCGVDRFRRPGKCGLKDKAYIIEPFVHIAEEAVITPAGSVKLFQCALHCTGCQSWELIHQRETVIARQGQVLDGLIWEACADFEQAATIAFVGGNPDESLYAILEALTGLPPVLASKPIVWNCHGYATPVVYDLLDGVVDVYIPDFKGCDACVERISKVKGYWTYVTQGIESTVRQPAHIIVRILVLPGHVPCCHAPALEWLAQYRDRLWISLLEFIPDYRALQVPQLNRRTDKEEMALAQELMQALGLRDVEERPEAFWIR